MARYSFQQRQVYKAGFPLRPYRTKTYWWACADWKQVYKSTYFRVYSRIKIKSSSQVNFLAYYGSTNQSTFTKFWNLKTFLIRIGTVRLKWKTGLTVWFYAADMRMFIDFNGASTVHWWVYWTWRCMRLFLAILQKHQNVDVILVFFWLLYPYPSSLNNKLCDPQGRSEEAKLNYCTVIC